MNSKASSNTLIACLIALLAVGAFVYYGGPAVRAEQRFELEAHLKQPFGGKIVEGAPFSAQVVVENTQTLANGVHVASKVTGALYRDSQGRTREEFPREGAPETAVINDNVEGVIYHLQMFERIAAKADLKSDLHREMEEYKQKREHEEREQMERIKEYTQKREHEEREQMERIKEYNQKREHEEREEMERIRTKGVALKHPGKDPEKLGRVESLGLQTYEGVQVEVTRLTVTIPAGMEGNDRAFEIVSERWYSPELRIVVMAKRSDPRVGEMVYRLTNLSRSEPVRSLFEVPGDFKVMEEKKPWHK